MAVEFDRLSSLFLHTCHRVVQGAISDEEVLICCHGWGSDQNLVDVVKTYPGIDAHLIGFNFPDYGMRANGPRTYFGTIEELIPLLSVLRRVVIDGKIAAVSLYGFSAGAGAIVNALALLNCNRFPSSLQQIGIGSSERKKILGALEKGYIILDCPLKSFDEILAINSGGDPKTRALSIRYQQNGMRPIDAVEKWKGLALHVLVHFQYPDQAVGNRDDNLFIERLRKANPQGLTKSVSGRDGGHLSYHSSLWRSYPQFMQEYTETVSKFGF